MTGNVQRSVFVAFVTALLCLIQIAQASDAIIAYRSNTNQSFCTAATALECPKIRFWDSSGAGSWGPEIELPTSGASASRFIVKQSPISGKIVLITLSTGGLLDAYVCTSDCGNPGAWTVTNDIGSVSAIAQRRYDFEFEASTGDAMVVYGIVSTNVSRDLAYKVLPAENSSFSGIPEQYIDDGAHATDLQYTWIKLDRRPAGNELILAGFDGTNNHANAWVWDGSAWDNQAEVSSNANETAGREALAARYAADGSKGVVLAANGTVGEMNYLYWDGAAWSAPSSFDVDPGDVFDVQWLSLKADPATDDLQAVMIDNQYDLHTAYWDGGTWSVTSNIDTDVDVFSTRDADFAWEPTGSEGILVWDTDIGGTTLSQRRCSPECTSPTSTVPGYGANGRWLTLYTNPSNTDNVLVLGARLNSAFNTGSFSFDGTAYQNYGDSAISPNATVSTYEAYNIAFLPQAYPSPNCPVIASAGSYTMASGFTGAPNSASPVGGTACVKIAASNVIFDCNGYSITNNGTAGTTYGILLNGSLTNVTVKNCQGVSNYTSGVYNYRSNNTVFSNIITFGNAQRGFHLDSSSYNNLVNNAAYNNSVEGFYLVLGAGNNLTGNSAYNNGRHGFYTNVVQGTLLAENEAHGNGGLGFLIWTSPNTTLAGNNISDNLGTGLFISRFSEHIAAFNNAIYGNGENGILVADSNHTSFTNNSVYGNGNNGFDISSFGTFSTGLYNMSIAGNSIYDNQWDGIQLSRSYGVAIENNSIHGNQMRGIFISSVSNVSGRNLHLYNNSEADVRVESSGPGCYLNLANATLDNPAGNFSGHLSVTFSDITLSGTTDYQIGWSAEPAEPPPGYLSFAHKYVNISTSVPGGAKIDLIRFNWLEDELGATYNESKFELWNYSATWSNTPGQALDLGNNYIEALSLPVQANGSVYGILQNNAIANISVMKVDVTPVVPVSPGGVVQWRINISNPGHLALDHVFVTDTLPPGFQYDSSSPVPDAISGDNTTINWTNVGPLAAGSSTLIFVNSSVGAVPSGTYYNGVSVTASPPYGNNVTDSGSAPVDISSQGIDLVKSVDPASVLTGQEISFMLNVSNSGDANLTVTMVDILPANVNFEGANVAPTSIIGNTITWLDVANLSAGESFVISYNATADRQGAYSNNAVAIGVPPSGSNATDSDAASFTVRQPGSSTHKTAAVEYETDCPDNNLTVTVTSGGAVSGANVRLLRTEPFVVLVDSQDTDGNGKAYFTFSAPNTYRIDVRADGYEAPDEVYFTYALCPVAPEPGCTNDADCAADEYCGSGTCTKASGTCGYASDHIWVNHECCADSGCAADKRCVSNACVLEPAQPPQQNETPQQPPAEDQNPNVSESNTTEKQPQDWARQPQQFDPCLIPVSIILIVIAGAGVAWFIMRGKK